MILLTRIIVKMQKTIVILSGGERVPLHNRLKEFRAAKNINQSELGQLVHVSRQTISMIERGDYSPSVTLALKLAHVFGVPVEKIFSYEEETEV